MCSGSTSVTLWPSQSVPLQPQGLQSYLHCTCRQIPCMEWGIQSPVADLGICSAAQAVMQGDCPSCPFQQRVRLLSAKSSFGWAPGPVLTRYFEIPHIMQRKALSFRQGNAKSFWVLPFQYRTEHVWHWQRLSLGRARSLTVPVTWSSVQCAFHSLAVMNKYLWNAAYYCQYCYKKKGNGSCSN